MRPIREPYASCSPVLGWTLQPPTLPKDRLCHGRHKQLDAYQMLELTYGEGHAKMHRYGELLRAC